MENTMISFHGDINIKNQLLSSLNNHAKLDRIIQGKYWENGKGCAVGCSIIDFCGDPEDHKEYERLFGIHSSLAKLEDGIFEGLSVEDSKWWPMAFSEAVPVGKDLSLVIPKFLVYVIEDVKQYAKESEKKSIQAVIDLYKKKISGKNIDLNEWRQARRNADAATAAADADDDAYSIYATYAAVAAAANTANADDAAAYAADASSYADYDAADAATNRESTRKKQALKLIEILEEG